MAPSEVLKGRLALWHPLVRGDATWWRAARSWAARVVRAQPPRGAIAGKRWVAERRGLTVGVPHFGARNSPSGPGLLQADTVAASRSTGAWFVRTRGAGDGWTDLGLTHAAQTDVTCEALRVPCAAAATGTAPRDTRLAVAALRSGRTDLATSAATTNTNLWRRAMGVVPALWSGLAASAATTPRLPAGLEAALLAATALGFHLLGLNVEPSGGKHGCQAAAKHTTQDRPPRCSLRDGDRDVIEAGLIHPSFSLGLPRQYARKRPAFLVRTVSNAAQTA